MKKDIEEKLRTYFLNRCLEDRTKERKERMKQMKKEKETEERRKKRK
jgi:uncharacterized protein (DUF2164 family)